MNFKQLIDERRSVRNFASSIDHNDLVAILTMACRAPSWKNQQTARCYAVETPETLEALRAAALPGFNQNSSSRAALIVTTFVKGVVGFNGDAPVNEVGDGWGAYDLGLHDAYLILAAKELGYDTLIMGIRDAGALRQRLNIPDNEQVMSVIAIGKSAEDAPLRARKALDEVVRFF